jgi:hypothetical protein
VADSRFYSAPAVKLSPGQAFEHIGAGSYRILLKRLEQHDADFLALLDELFAKVNALRPELRHDKVIRLESFLFISSASTITPFHFDPEINLFFQIAGDKEYHMYGPAALSEAPLERHYLRGSIDIGHADLRDCADKDEFLFSLRPGLGMHQPMNCPHWVQTQNGLSISYSFSIETKRTRAMARTVPSTRCCAGSISFPAVRVSSRSPTP